MVWLGRAVAFIRLGRPHFLVGGVVMYHLGVAAAVYAGAPLDLFVYIWGQVAVTAIQYMTAYANDCFDLEADRANEVKTAWAGGSRVLPAGLLPPWTALGAALLLATLAMGAVVVLAARGASPLAWLALLIAMFLAWEYSAPPLRLHSTGWGEITAAVILTGISPMVGFCLQTGAFGMLPLLAAVPLFFLQIDMLISVGIPDREADSLVGKRTLIVRLGAPRAVALYVLALLLAYVSLPLLALAGLPRQVAGAAALSLPIAAWLAWRTYRRAWDEPRHWSSLAFWTIFVLIVTALAEGAAFFALASIDGL